MKPPFLHRPLTDIPLIVFLLFASYLAEAQTVGAPSIQICEGGQTVCIEDNVVDLCVKITVEPGYPEKIDSFQINWDDGTHPQSLVGSNSSFNLSYRYDFGALFESCNYQSRKLVSLSTYINGDDRPIVSFFPLTALNPPEAKFDRFPRVVCAGEQIEIYNASCPAEVLESVYDFGDGTQAGNSPFHTYTDTGTYTVTLAVANDCGEDITTRQLRVIDKPRAVAFPDSGLTKTGNDIPLVCLNGEATIRLNGASSVGLIRRNWSVTPQAGVTLSRPGQLLSHATFTQPGRYRFSLSGTNGNCVTNSSDTFSVEVVRASELTLIPQADACISLDYCPTPWVESATYRLNGQVIDSCLTALTPGTYFLEASTQNPICGDVTLRDTFIVSPQAVADIVQSDTTICDQSGLMILHASPKGGRWAINGAPFDGVIDPQSYSPGRYRVTYGNEPCLTTDELWIEVTAAEVTVPLDTFLCLGSDPVTFQASPAGGTFSGDFVTPEGLFDPNAAGTGTHRIHYAYHNPDLAGCADQASFQVVVSDLEVDFVTQSCGGEETCFALVGELPYERVEWSYGDGSVSEGRQMCHTYAEAGTYPVTVTVYSGPCSSSLTREISVAPSTTTPPHAEFVVHYDPDDCSDLEVSLEDDSYGSDIIRTWYLGDKVISTSTVPAPLTLPSRSYDTLYTVTLEVRNGCSISSKTDSIFVRASPVASFGTDRQAYCSGDTIRLVNQTSGEAQTYTWLLNDKVIGTGPVPPTVVHETEVLETLTLCLQITHPCGVDEQCYEVTVGPGNLNSFFRLEAAEVCVGDTVRLTNFTAAGAQINYAFGDGNGSAMPDPVYVYRQPGTYRITQMASGCGADSSSMEVTVLERPTARFDAPANVCDGEEFQLTHQSGEHLSATWDFGDGSPVSHESSPFHIFPGPGTYRVCLTVQSRNGNGCSHSVCTDITVNARPSASFTVPDTVCAGQAIALRSTASGDLLNCTYKFGESATLVDCEPEYVFPEAGSYRVLQIVTDARGCQDSTEESVYVRPAPVAAFSMAKATACVSEPLLLANETEGATQVTWAFGDGNISSEASPVHPYDTEGVYDISLATSDGFCATSVTKSVEVRPAPVARFGVSDGTVCVGQSIQFTGSSTGDVRRRRWSFGDGEAYAGTDPTYTFTEAGSFDTRLQVSDDRGCSDSAGVTITVLEPAAIGIREMAPVTCSDGTDGILVVEVMEGVAPFTYAWSSTGEKSAKLIGVGAGTYTVEVTDSRGCVSSENHEVIAPLPIQVVPDIADVSCYGGQDGVITLRLSGGEGPLLASWDDGDQGTSRSGLAADTYALRVTDNMGCTLDTAFTVRENEPLSISYMAADVSCFDHSDGVVSYGTPSGGVGPYRISLLGTEIDRRGAPNSRFTDLDAGIYILEVADANNCAEAYDIQIMQPEPLVLDILHDTLTLPLGGTVELLTRYSDDQPSITWSPDYHLSCDECPVPLASPFLSQDYTASITDERGCSIRDTVHVAVEMGRDIYLPNTFTPNGDGLNDRFRVRAHQPEAIERVDYFEIRDRWGMLVYSANDFPANDPSYGWDGVYGGEPADPGTYAYQVKVSYVDGFEKTISGSILIIR
ncbi:PKD domain-containing protein [Lewinella sp. IMCC34191]|uniref:PKD domain-containing protein n=1 Tax=Lewinella sp. IMCC34191 TaxID=2259172 RepID=UPI000E232CB8|nr:PKD domain-containing protein [Lewinella sp. IMCC34191]